MNEFPLVGCGRSGGRRAGRAGCRRSAHGDECCGRRTKWHVRGDSGGPFDATLRGSSCLDLCFPVNVRVLRRRAERTDNAPAFGFGHLHCFHRRKNPDIERQRIDHAMGRCIGQRESRSYERSQQAKAVAVSPDGKLLASGNWDTTVRLWDSAAERNSPRLPGTPSVAHRCVFPGRLVARKRRQGCEVGKGRGETLGFCAPVPNWPLCPGLPIQLAG